MCELFGINSDKKISINDYLRTFFSHSEQHDYGWGLACFYGNSVSLEKEALKANSSHYLRQRLQHPIVIDNAIAHIRLATVGNMAYENCHPFIKHDKYGRCWTLAHNGTIFDFPMLDRYKEHQEGKTDSERILFYIIDCLNTAQELVQRPLNFEERFDFIDGLLEALSPGNKINLLIWDGEAMYVHYNYANTLYVNDISDQTKIFSTQPLSNDDTWHEVEFLRLLAYKNGQLVMRGAHQTTEYSNPVKNWEYQNIDYSYL
jgi:glutamine amidotransferase